MSLINQHILEDFLLDGTARTYRQACDYFGPWNALERKFKAEMQVDRTIHKLKRKGLLVGKPRYRPYRITWVAVAKPVPAPTEMDEAGTPPGP